MSASPPAAPDQRHPRVKSSTLKSSLLASAAVLSLAVAGAGLHAMNGKPASGTQASAARYSNAAAPASAVAMPSFADLVDGVRRAVVSIRVNAVQASGGDGEDANPFAGMPFERFFRGSPRGNSAPFEDPRGARRSIQGQGSPRIDVALAGDKFVVAFGGDQALRDVTSPGTTLSESDAFKAAGAKLGDGVRPAFYLDVAKTTALVASKAGSDPDFAKAKPYLDAFAALVAGAKDEGEGVTRARFAITLK